MTGQGQQGAAEDTDAGPPPNVGAPRPDTDTHPPAHADPAADRVVDEVAPGTEAGTSEDATSPSVPIGAENDRPAGADASSASETDAEAGTVEPAEDGPRARIVLVGPPGSGKSTIGRKLARELGVELFDTDAGIEAETGRGIPEIFATDGEPEFRRIEEDVVRRAVLEHDGVVSLGGGSVLSARTREVLHGATVVYLEISVGEGLRRTGSSNARPLLNGTDPAAKYRELMRIRRPLYREVATVRVRTDGRSPGRVVRMILAKLGLESVRTDLDAQRGTGTASAATGSVTSRPGVGSNRSRARRRARARAAAARRAATAQPGTIDRSGPILPGGRAATDEGTEANTAASTAGERTGAQPGEPGTRATGARRPRRARSRRGGRLRSAAANAQGSTSTSGTAGPQSSGARNAGRTSGTVNTQGSGAPQGSGSTPRTAGTQSSSGPQGSGSAPGITGAQSSGGASGTTDTQGFRGTRGAGSTSGVGGAGNESGGTTSGRRGAVGQAGDADRSANQAGERARRKRPRRRGRSKTNDQKESEQRT